LTRIHQMIIDSGRMLSENRAKTDRFSPEVAVQSVGFF
jgi:hypothetical protein